MTIRWKLVALIIGVVIPIAVLNVWLIPNRAAEAERASLRDRCAAAAALAGALAETAVDMGQADSAQAELETLRNDPLVVWVGIYDGSGRRIGAVGRGAPRRIEARTDAREFDAGGNAIGAAAPLTGLDGVVGSAVVALDSRGVSRRRGEAQRDIVIQAAAVTVCGILFALFVATRATRPIVEITEAARRIARGDVSGALEIRRTNDELGVMAEEFEQMSGRLRELQERAALVASGDLTTAALGDGELYVAFDTMVANLRHLAGRISGSSDSVENAAAGMFAAVREQEAFSTQQNASLEEIRRTLEVLSETGRRVAADARAVRETSQRSLASSREVTERTRLLSTHSERIGEILMLIQDIADKSDLLALNAALEGTRAGEVGRGFSLVAEEMRRLSEHVMDSVRDIRKLVADMGEASHASMLATEQGIKLAQETAEAAAKISEAVERQLEGTDQVKTAADEIVHVVNESLKGSGETTQLAETLLELAGALSQAVEAFQVGELVRGDRGAPHDET